MKDTSVCFLSIPITKQQQVDNELYCEETHDKTKLSSAVVGGWFERRDVYTI